MLDFTSSCYLGMRHPSGSFRPWEHLTTGRPAALDNPVGICAVAARIAKLQGCEQGILASSTFHVFWDLFKVLSSKETIIYIDEQSYPIAQWGVQRARWEGIPVRTFSHHDAEALQHLMRQDAAGGVKPLIVTDGFCPHCGRLAPIARYVESMRPVGGQLVLDDTQALGILGRAVGLDAPFGRGGGGTLQWTNIHGLDLVVVSSLAKGLGVPVAVLCGSEPMIRRFARNSLTRLHCSPPSIATIHAAEHALEINQTRGDRLRYQLAQRVQQFHTLCKKAGLVLSNGFFPVQTLPVMPIRRAQSLYRHLLRRGVRTVMQHDLDTQEGKIGFLITARHGSDEINYAATRLSQAIQQ